MGWSISSYFWRWDQIQIARDGVRPYISGPLPHHNRKARIVNPEHKYLILQKIRKYIEQGYLVFTAAKEVKSFLDYFDVPKGDFDI